MSTVVVLNAFNRSINSFADTIVVGAGAKLCALVEFANSGGFQGLERLAGIPGTVGGAIRMNAGAYGQDIGSHVDWVETIDLRSGHMRVWSNQEAKFEYRSTVIATEPVVIVRAGLKLNAGDEESTPGRIANLYAESNRLLALRATKIPYHLPNTGSVFKRPRSERPIGELVEALGLKGFRINDAMISREHAGIIVNTGSASGQDIKVLIDRIQCKVERTYGISMELEQVVI